MASILRKAEEERNINIHNVILNKTNVICNHPSERALALEILCFSDIIQSTIFDLMPNRLCDYLKELSTKFSDFVTKCQVLNSDEVISRLALCEATKRVMDQAFHLLGIQPLERL